MTSSVLVSSDVLSPEQSYDTRYLPASTYECLYWQHVRSSDDYSIWRSIGILSKDNQQWENLQNNTHFSLMPFNIQYAPATFQRSLNNILFVVRWTTYLGYINDVVIFFKSNCQHVKSLYKILKLCTLPGRSNSRLIQMSFSSDLIWMFWPYTYARLLNCCLKHFWWNQHHSHFNREHTNEIVFGCM